MRRLEAASGSALSFSLRAAWPATVGDAVLVEAAAHQHVVGRVGAGGGEAPVVVGLVAERPRIGVAVDGERALLLGEDLADLLHGENQFAARHGRADLEHAEVELVGDGDGDAILAGDDGQAFRELVVRAEGLGELLADRVGRLDGCGTRLAFHGLGFLPRAWLSSGFGSALASGSSGAASAGASAFGGIGFVVVGREAGAGWFHAFGGLAAATPAATRNRARRDRGRPRRHARRSTGRTSARRRRPWC